MVKILCEFGQINGAHIGVQVAPGIPTIAMRPEHTHLQMLLMQQATAAKKKAFTTISFAANWRTADVQRLCSIKGSAVLAELK